MCTTTEHDSFQVVREYYQSTGDIAETLKLFPPVKRSSVEHQLLMGMKKHGKTDLLAALSFVSQKDGILH